MRVEDHTLKSLHRPVHAEFLFGGALHIVENRPGRSTFGQPPEVRHREHPLPARRSFRECGPHKPCDFRDAGKPALNPAPPTLLNSRADLVTARLRFPSLLHRLTLPEGSQSHACRNRLPTISSLREPAYEIPPDGVRRPVPHLSALARLSIEPAIVRPVPGRG